MNQEQIAYRLTGISKVTGEVLLKLIFLALQETEEKLQQHLAAKNFTSETSWNKFLATSDEKYFKEFLSTELHTKALKDYLNEHNIGFALQKLPDGKMEIAIDAKNIQQLENFLTKFKQEVSTAAEAEVLTERLSKESNPLTLEDMLAKYEKQVDNEIAQAQQTKAPAPQKEVDKEL
ncbi:hypothetical protein [Streptococcus ovis]|uniref:hypothetical protein n=1 Tax=Streptococcus ovis TaxID=82806 RepID=UPI00037AE559|nr:hypothetical protein [Streptococcus ovis]